MNIELAFKEAQTAFSSEQYDKVLDICSALIEYEPSGAEYYALAGNAELSKNELTQAELYFKRAIEINPYVGVYYFNLANCYFGQKRLAEALNNYSRAVDLGCNDTVTQKVYYIMGLINQSINNDYENALVNYKKSELIQGVNENQVDILLNKVQIYVELHRFSDAESCALQLKLLLPNEFQSYQLLFQIYLEQKKIKEAKQILQEAESTLVLASEITTEIGFDKAMLLCFMAEQDAKNAEHHYKKALQQLASLEDNTALSEKDRCEILLTSADIYMKLERYDRTIELAKRVVVITDKDLTEYRERAVYTLLTCADIAKEYVTVSEYAKLLKNSENLFYRHHGYYAEAYASKMNNTSVAEPTEEYVRLYEIAIAYYKNAVVSSPGDILAYLYRAKSYVDIGEFDRAREIAELLPEDSKKQLFEYISEVEKG